MPAKWVFTREQSIAFARALADPPQPNEALLKAARRYSFRAGGRQRPLQHGEAP